MASINPFRALRYDLAKIGSLGRVVTPPYDVISPEAREGYLARDPRNVIRLILETGEDRHAKAAARWRAWREEGVLRRDEAPAFYVVEDSYHVKDASGHDVARRRRGLLALARIEDPGSKLILPHERTLAGPRDDRLALMSAVKAQLSPVFLISPDKDGAFRALLDRASEQETLAAFEEESGGRHRLARVLEPGLIARIQEALADRPLLIADGHHRYESARAYRDLRRAEEAGPRTGREAYEFVMVLIASMDDPGTTVRGYHRVVRETGMPPEALRERLSREFTLTTVARATDADATERLLGAMTEADARGEVAFGVAMGGGDNLDVASKARDGAAPPLERLDVSVLHHAILERALGMTEDDFIHQRRIDYTPDPDAALARVRSGSHAAAFLLNPTPPGAVLEVASRGQVMPQKSTYFYPKLLTGLAFHPMDPGDQA